MKTLISDYDYELHLGGTAKPGIQKTLDCRGDLRNLCGPPLIALVDVDRAPRRKLSDRLSHRESE
jgi:hypothetical protein